MLIPIFLSFFLSWVVVFAFYIATFIVMSPVLPLAVPISMWILGIVALITMKIKGMKIPIFRKVNRYYFLAPILVLAITGGTILISLPFTHFQGFENLRAFLPAFLSQMESVTYHVTLFSFISLEGFIAGLTINLLVALGSEIFWRGYVLEKLKDMSYFKRSILIGFLSGIWAIPLVCLGLNYPRTPWLGMILMIIFSIVIAPLAEYFRIKGNSLLGSSALIGSIYSIRRLSLMVFATPNYLLMGITGAAGILLFSGASLYVLLTEKKWRPLPSFSQNTKDTIDTIDAKEESDFAKNC